MIIVLVACTVTLRRSVPVSVVAAGGIAGLRSALLAVGMVLVFRASRVVNFAQAATGAVGAALVFNFSAIGITGFGRIPFWVSAALAVAVSALLGAVMELVFVRRFASAPRLVVTVVTVVAASALTALAGNAASLPFWPDGPDVVASRVTALYRGPHEWLHVDVAPIRFGFPAAFTIVAGVAALGGVALYLRKGRGGRAVVAAAENRERAQLLGINVGAISTAVWALSGLLAGVAAVGQGLDGNWTNANFAPHLLLPALAAAVLARFERMPAAALIAIVLGAIEAAVRWAIPATDVFPILLLAVIAAGLLLRRSSYSRAHAAVPADATAEPRPVPEELLALPEVRFLRRGLLVAGFVLLAVTPLASGASRSADVSRIAIDVLTALSLVVLTGWGGQVSLGQLAFVLAGGLVSSKLTADLGVSFWVALPATCLLVALLAAVVGQPALRLRGPFLPVATLAFAAAAEAVAFRTDVGKSITATSIERPTLLWVSFSSERAYYYLCVGVAVLACLLVRRLRAGRAGRVLIAIREDEYGVQPFGINSGRTRLAVFALAGVLAGLAGVLLAHQQRSVDASAFEVADSIDIFIMATVGGITSVSGAVLGALYFGLSRIVVVDEQLRRLTTSGGLLALLYLAPGGLAGLAYATRDTVLRIVAMRRRIHVPGLVPWAAADCAIALGPRVDGRGLDLLPVERRYRLRSALYEEPAPEAGGHP